MTEFIMRNGIYKGRPISEVKWSYLDWMVRVNHTHAEEAVKERKRRVDKAEAIGLGHGDWPGEIPTFGDGDMPPPERW